jgi:CCR4-NOT transcriptional regulation complex NOT5 subunit
MILGSCMQGTIQQAFAAMALKSQQWHYHTTLRRWFHMSPQRNSQVNAVPDAQGLNP